MHQPSGAPKSRIMVSLNQYFTQQPKQRWRQLQWAIGAFFIGVLIVYLAATFEWQWLFYIGAGVMGLAVLYALPAYLALIIWRIYSSRNNRRS